MRTQVHTARQSKFNNKWSISFQNLAGYAGTEYLHSEVESAAVFSTENCAIAAGARALNVLEETGRFPNMCEPF